LRIRILKQSEGVLDGVSLSRFVPGLIYEVPVSLGAFLVAKEAAEEDATSTIAVVIPLTKESASLRGGVSVSSSPADRAADRPRRRKQDRRTQ
jgi:hypothetical protein